MSQSLAKALAQLDYLLENFHTLSQDPQEARGSILAAEKEDQAPSVPVASAQHESTSAKPQQKTTKADKKAAKQAKSPIKVAAESEGSLESALADTFAKARLVVGIVRSVEELDNSDKLYRCQVQIGPTEEETKQIIAGLRLHVPRSEMEGRRVVTILNLKTAKLAGQVSEGMILAAVQKGEAHDHSELVKPLGVPESASPGDSVTMEGRDAQITYPKEFRQWSKVLPQLQVRNHLAHFGNLGLVTASGPVSVDPNIPDGASIS